MEMHSVAAANIAEQMEKIKKASRPSKQPEAFTDPIREFSRASRYEGMVRGWLTYPLEERKRLIKDSFSYQPQMEGETDGGFENRMLERWRALCVIMQEESRLRFDKVAQQFVQGSPEVATACLKLLYPTHEWAPRPALPAGK
jgi:hypothetical protein